MNKITDNEFLVLEELYLISSFHNLLSSTGLSEKNLSLTLTGLLKAGYCEQYFFESGKNDFQLKMEPDFNNLSLFHYLATKKGMMAHHS